MVRRGRCHLLQNKYQSTLCPLNTRSNAWNLYIFSKKKILQPSVADSGFLIEHIKVITSVEIQKTSILQQSSPKIRFKWNPPFVQKQPSRGVLRKRCSENIQQICKRKPMPKCNFNRGGLKSHFRIGDLLYIWKHIFRTPFYRNTYGGLWRVPSVKLIAIRQQIIDFWNVVCCVPSGKHITICQHTTNRPCYHFSFRSFAL